MKKVVFVINYFHPDYASTGQLMTDLCLNLKDDFNITVIAAQPNYAGELVKSKKRFEEDYLKNIKIVRLRLPRVDKNSKFSRLKYISTYFCLANLALLKEKKVDLIYTISQPPILGGLIGTIGKLIKKCKHIYNIQDFNPEQAAAVNYTKSIVSKIAMVIDKINCRMSDNIILVGNDMSNTLEKRFNNKNVPQHVIINNWTNEKELIPYSKKELNIKKFLNENKLNNKFIIMYSGNLGLYYDLENLISISLHFKDKKDIAFVFIGEGAMKNQMESFVNENNVSNVHFLPYQSKDFIKYSLNAADIHLVVNQKGIKGVSVPSKIYGVMAVGKPILGVLEKDSEAEMLIEKSGCGVVVEPKDYTGIIKQINNFYEMNSDTLNLIGQNGRDYLDRNLKMEISIEKYRKIINRELNDC